MLPIDLKRHPDNVKITVNAEALRTFYKEAEQVFTTLLFIDGSSYELVVESPREIKELIRIERKKMI